MRRVYFPMTCSILTPGHIKCLKYLRDNYTSVIVGLLTDNALKGYKNGVAKYKDRLYILENLDIKKIIIVPQDTLNPKENIKKYKCDYLASGDGFEQVELDAIRELGLFKVDIKLDGEKKKMYSSTEVYNNLKTGII